MKNPIERQDAIDILNVGAELLRRVLDDADVVGADREKYSWGLGLIESYIDDIEELPSAQPEIIRCKDCVHYYGEPGNPNIICFQMHEDDFCSYGERREE